MRQRELVDGVVITDAEGNKLGTSSLAAQRAITKVTISRVTIAAPGMLLTPIIMQQLENQRFMRNVGNIGNCAIQTFFVGVCLVGMVPVGCSLFPHQQSITLDKLEPELVSKVREKRPDLVTVYYNKGL